MCEINDAANVLNVQIKVFFKVVIALLTMSRKLRPPLLASSCIDEFAASAANELNRSEKRRKIVRAHARADVSGETELRRRRALTACAGGELADINHELFLLVILYHFIGSYFRSSARADICSTASFIAIIVRCTRQFLAGRRLPIVRTVR